VHHSLADSPDARPLRQQSYVVVGVIDSGWDRTIVEPRVVTGLAFSGLPVRLTSDDHDRHGHGTMCTNIILDATKECTVLPIRVFGTDLETSPDMLVEAISCAADCGLKLINLSLGTLRRDAARALYLACDAAARRGVIIVAAARPGANGWSYPAVFEPVIGVGSAKLEDHMAIRYRPGDSIECGVRTSRRSTRGLGGFATVVDGTSFGAPLVTALVARWLGDTPDLTVVSVRARFERASNGGTTFIDAGKRLLERYPDANQRDVRA
jgi:subtilisin family serine protease